MFSIINRGAAYMIATLIGFLGTVTFGMSGPFGIVLVFVGPALAILLHELGHAFAAWRFGMRVHEIAVGPLALRFRPTRLALADAVLGKDVGGHVLFDEIRGRYLTSRSDALITAAGPLANLAGAVLCFAAANAMGDNGLARTLAGLGFTSFAAFVLSAWPVRLESGQGNDAMKLVQIFASQRLDRRRVGKSKRSPWQAP